MTADQEGQGAPTPSPHRGRAAAAVAMALLGLGLLVAALSVLVARHSSAWWVVPLPAVGAYVVLILGVVMRNQDNPLAQALSTALEVLLRRPALAAAAAALFFTATAGVTVYLVRTANASDGDLRLVVFDGQNIDGSRAVGMKAELEHITGDLPTVAMRTDKKGVVGFPVRIGDAVTVRLLRGDDTYVVHQNKTVKADDLASVESINLAEIDPRLWLSSRKFAAFAETVGFATLDPGALRWNVATPARLVGNDAGLRDLWPFGAPRAEYMIVRAAFVSGFSPTLKQPRWVASEISDEKPGPRGMDRNLKDPAIDSALQADPDDYTRNLYDRAHLVSRQDVGAALSVSSEPNYMTMITPQTDVLNRGLWSDLERYARELKTPDNRVLILRGPGFAGPAGTAASFTVLGRSRIPVPTDYFQILAVINGAGVRFECHIIPNAISRTALGPRRDLARYRVRLTAIEQLTGLQPISAAERSRVCP